MDELILKNPITASIKEAAAKSSQTLKFAVPFMSSFALSVLDPAAIENIADKRLITRFDPSCLVSFDIPVLEKFLKMGFKIRYDNNIHLKLYITDFETYVTSSNFTKGGFEGNTELTVRIDSKNTQQCSDIFEEIWQQSPSEITEELLRENLDQYHLLKKKEDFTGHRNSSDVAMVVVEGPLDSKRIIEEIFKMGKDYFYLHDLTFQASTIREHFKDSLKKGFDKRLFYAPEHHSKRHENLFYDFTYGKESKIAGTGLRELQFSTAFEHPEFQKAIQFIYPEMIGMQPWNLADNEELYRFCCGLFDFKIPQYTEVLPIRMASYFYPEYFIPIYKISDLEKICNALNLQTDAQTRGQKLYAYSVYIRKEMQHLPYDGNINFNLAYIILHTFELLTRLQNGELYGDIISGTTKDWKRKYFAKGMLVLQRLGAVRSNEVQSEAKM